jgi:bifunctional DNA-binding transcriptional regulator/antitoxin component of YhaV-PrlF toxin-antitoxin module
MMFVTSCHLMRLGKDEAGGSKTPKVLASKDGKAQVTLPAGWREAQGLSEEADIQAMSSTGEMYVIVTSEAKEDFADDMTLDRVATLTRENVMMNLSSPEATSPTPLEIGGHQARQYELRGAVEGVNITYINTTVETPRNYYHIATWTLPSRFDKNRGTLQEVTRSFREVGAPKPGANTSGPPAQPRQ